MRFLNSSFLENDSGAVTVDWVVVTAALIGVAMLVLGPIAFNLNSLAGLIGEWVSDANAGAPDESDGQGG